MVGHGRILIGVISLDYASTALATAADTAALSILKPDGTTVTAVPENVTRIVMQNTAAADGVLLKAGGSIVSMVGSAAFLDDAGGLMYKGQAVTARSIFGALAVGKLYVALYN